MLSLIIRGEPDGNLAIRLKTDLEVKRYAIKLFMYWIDILNGEVSYVSSLAESKEANNLALHNCTVKLSTINKLIGLKWV